MSSADKYEECPECGGDDVREVVEITASAPWGTGYMIWVCSSCGAQVGESRFVGF